MSPQIHIWATNMLDVTNCDFTENTAHKIYLNIPIKRLYKNKLKASLHLVTCRRIL